MPDATRQRAPLHSEATFRLQLIAGGADTCVGIPAAAAEPVHSAVILAPNLFPSPRRRRSTGAPQPALPCAAPPSLPAGTLSVDEQLATLLASHVAYELRCFPFHRAGGWLFVAADNPERQSVARRLSQETGLSIVVADASAEAVDIILQELYAHRTERPLSLQVETACDPHDMAVSHSPAWAGFEVSSDVRDHMGDIRALTQQAVVEARERGEEVDTASSTSYAARLTQQLLLLAMRVDASDVHLEPGENTVRVRMRLDGVLQPVVELPRAVLGRLVGRIKVLASMNLVEKRLPQEARFQHRHPDGRRVDIRVSTMPVVNGEGIVLRLLDTANLRSTVEDLGLEGDDLSKVQRCLRGPRGLVLATGPTGSGKSTTLYTLTMELNDATRKIVTIEDPVEYHVDGLQQVQVQSGIGLGFDRVIRSTLRQDPDVILVGEIRDGETARAAVKAALTGHLVLSSLHTADAAGAVARLVDLGVEPGMCAAALRLIIAQRLIRTLCPNCRQPVPPDGVHDLLKMAGIDPVLAELSYGPVGCVECRNIGYRGRCAIFEIMDLNSARLRRLIQGGAAAEVLHAAAMEEQMTSLADAALNLVRRGETSVEEALRVVWLD